MPGGGRFVLVQTGQRKRTVGGRIRGRKGVFLERGGWSEGGSGPEWGELAMSVQAKSQTLFLT